MEGIRFFNYIVIDTNAFDAKKNDFCGLSDSIIPAFFKIISDNKMIVLSHPVLIGETLKHIDNLGKADKTPKEQVSKIVKAISQNKYIFSMTSLDPEKIMEELEAIDTDKLENDNQDRICKNKTAFNTIRESFQLLPYSDPATVFQKYFSCEPPFAQSGDKKSEFPDAFVIQSLLDFINTHKEKKYLVISNDKDWKKALADIPLVTMVDTINDAIRLLNKQEELTRGILQKISILANTIKAQIVRDIKREAIIYLRGYDLDSDVEIERIEVTNFMNNPITLFASDNEVLLQAEAEIIIDGFATIIDQNHLSRYAPILDMNFQNAKGIVTYEIRIELNGEKEPSLNEMQIIMPDGFIVNVDEDQAQFSERDFEADARAEMLDSFEDYYNH